MIGTEITRTARLVLLAVVFFGAGCVTSGGLKPGGREPQVVRIIFPLAADSVRFTSGFGDPREGGKRRHNGQDLFCPRWTPILAAVSGTVDWVSTERPKKEKGYELLLRGDDGNLYFYAHLNNDDPGTRDNDAPPRYAYARGLRSGNRVDAGEIVGYVGDSGDAEAAGPHLHFEIHIGKWGNPIDPAPSLKAALERRSR
ncbi:MAG TPA: M23 family metallopeptidase [Vicinamibacterales bacterium]|nr:M23 family metallopeptidase [Vicinamibacterales bacterium]